MNKNEGTSFVIFTHVKHKTINYNLFVFIETKKHPSEVLFKVKIIQKTNFS
jgi:hypothetical protein